MDTNRDLGNVSYLTYSVVIGFVLREVLPNACGDPTHVTTFHTELCRFWITVGFSSLLKFSHNW